MKHRTREDRAELIRHTLHIFREGIEPAVWEARRLDRQGYVRLQTSRDGTLTAEDFAGERRTLVRVKPDRAMLRDPHKIIRLLQESSPIRLEVLGESEMWPQHLETLRVARNLWAHFEDVSSRLADNALESAEQLLRGVEHPRAFAAAERIADLCHNPRERALVLYPRWPQPAA